MSRDPYAFDGDYPLVLHNARVLTMDTESRQPSAVALHGHRIVAVGSDELCRGAANGTPIINCNGLLLVPGFIDAHIHLLATAVANFDIPCGADTIAELTQRLRKASGGRSQGCWVRGTGYREIREEATTGLRRHVTKRDLDAVIRDAPVRLRHVSGHASVLNSEGLRRLQITAQTEEPAGGSILRELRTGEPSGVLLEMEDWLDRRMPGRTSADLENGMRRLSERLLASGVTSVQDLGYRNDSKRACLLADFARRGVFRPRITLATGFAAFAAGERPSLPELAEGPVKIMVNETGPDPIPSAAELQRRVLAIHRAGRQAAVHAVDERTVASAVDAIASAQSTDGRRSRHRIEHASVTSPQLADRIASEDIVVVSNPAFIWDHGDRYQETVENLRNLYDVAGLQQAGVQVAAGSDSPVVSAEPSLGIGAAMNRTAKTGQRLPGTVVRLKPAIGLYTSGAAFACHQEREKGRIAPGLLADLVLVDDCANAVRPVMTILGGEVAWRSEQSTSERRI